MLRRWLVLATALLACSEPQKNERPVDEKVALGGEIAARVAGTPIPVSVVQSVATAQKITAEDAVRRVIDDEIAASAARAKGIDREEPAAWNLIAARGRITADHIYADAVKQGPPTDDEVKELSERHWAEVDRPPTMKVIHVLVFHPKDKSLEPQARALAEQIHDAVAGATSQADFEARVKAVPHDKKLETRVEVIGTFTADGLFVEGEQVDPIFSHASDKLAPGGTSPIVETPSFGYHVIRLLERYPAMQMPFEDRRTAFREEAYAMRGGRALNAAMGDLTAKFKVEVLPAAESLMRSVSIEREPQASLP